MWDDFRPIDAHRRFLGICLADEERLIAKQQEQNDPALEQKLVEVRAGIALARSWIEEYNAGLDKQTEQGKKILDEILTNALQPSDRSEPVLLGESKALTLTEHLKKAGGWGFRHPG